MKRFLRTTAFVLTYLFVATISAQASNDQPTTVAKLPKAAQETLKTVFANKKVSLAMVDKELFDTSYDIIFTNGDKVEFDGKGRWTELKCNHSQVPAKLIPAAIASFVKEHYPSAKIVEMERDRHEYEVKLNTGVEITFNKKFQVTDIDN